LAFTVSGDRQLLKTRQNSRDSDLPVNLHSFALASPIVAQFTPCGYPLATDDGEPAYALVDGSLNVKEAFTLSNEFACCGAISEPRADWLSPKVVPVERTVQKLGESEFLCGAPLAYRNGNVVKHSSFVLGPGSGFFTVSPLPPSRPILRLANGTRLIRDGPIRSFRYQSHSDCAGCPWAKFAIYALKPSGDIQEALSLGGRIDGEMSEHQIQMFPDWRMVVEFRSDNHGHWRSKRFCLSNDTYHACGENDDATPPKYGILKPIP
jgi:hypothetical protein